MFVVLAKRALATLLIFSLRVVAQTIRFTGLCIETMFEVVVLCIALFAPLYAVVGRRVPAATL